MRWLTIIVQSALITFAAVNTGRSSESGNVLSDPSQDSISAIAASSQKQFFEKLERAKNPHLNEAATYLQEEYNKSNSLQLLPDTTARANVNAYPLMAALWQSPTIYVCWENPTPEFTRQMSDVQASISSTWQAATKLKFMGWSRCINQTSPLLAQLIRIKIDDSDPDNGPHTIGLGNQISGIAGGMVLNFTFVNWSPDCQAMISYCIKAIAVHEFGHAIGFAHEQNRPDKPGECMKPIQGSSGDNLLLTPYDPNSVMNYCNRKYNNDGNLSSLDIKAAQVLYGKP